MHLGGAGFSPKKFYDHCFREVVADDAFKWIWRSKCTNKWRVFPWLLLADRLNTRNMLKRRGMKLRDDVYACLLCDSPPEETVEHLFFHCPFSRACWMHLGIDWMRGGNRLQIVHEARARWTNPMFMDIFIVSAWSIWKERNNRHFRGVLTTFEGWLVRFRADFHMMRYRVKEALVPFVNSFVTSL